MAATSGKGRLVYIWVAENKHDSNPHVHLLTNYTVPRSEFDEHARHVESLRGLGWVKIERIRNPEKAGRYIMKALGYSLKGPSQDQGTVIGNRYGIARAILPKCETISLYDCTASADGLHELIRTMTDEIEELDHGLWLTPYGLAFGAGTEFKRITEVVQGLGGSSPRAETDQPSTGGLDGASPQG